MLKQLSNTPEYIQVIPEYFNDNSNLFSTQELILIRWLEIHGLDETKTRISNLEVDLKDGQILSNLIKSYVKSQTINKILQLNDKCQTEEVYL